jgi:O-antigen ligase
MLQDIAHSFARSEMNPRQITALLIFGSAIVLAVCAGISIAMEDYWLLWLAAGAIFITGSLVTPGYVPLLVFGLLIPFSLPIPFIWNMPFLLLALGVCIVKYWLERGLTIHKHFSPISTVNWSCALFFAWVFLRYCMKPSIPNIMGFGRNVTGFRAWLSYALCFGVLFFLGRFIGSRQGLHKLVRWLAIVSVAFILLLVPAALSKSMTVLAILTYFGMFATTFDNGFLRIVALPGFGLILFSLALLPNLLHLKPFTRSLCVILALSAIVMGGNRSSFGTALIFAISIPLLRRKFLQAAAVTGTLFVLIASVYFAGPVLSRLPETGFLRMLALVSPDLARVTGGEANMEWREVRWERALERIRTHPFVGEGYGGLENAWDAMDSTQLEEQGEEMSLATGGIHNGYLASALALGVPASLFFIYILLQQIILNARRAYGYQSHDPVIAEAHCFVTAYLLACSAGIFIGSDLNDPMIWLYIGLGTFLIQLRTREERLPKRAFSPAQPLLAGQIA